MSRVRVVFLGTPDFAVTCLKGLFEDDHFHVVGAVTQPDRPAGRRMILQPSAVKNYCLAHGIPVISPDSVNSELILQQLEVWSAEVAVVVAFGQLLSEKFLKTFPLGAVNIHGSLLPRWRGAAPIQRAIEAGDTQTGVTLQKVVRKLDAGDILGVRTLPLTEQTEAQGLFRQMSQEAVSLLQIELMDYVRGNLVGLPQDESLVTYAKKIEKSEGEIDWSQSAEGIDRKVRAFTMGPGTWSFFKGKKVKIHRTHVVTVMEDVTEVLAGEESLGVQGQEVGDIIRALPDQLWVKTGKGFLAVQELQPESRNRMTASAFLKGYCDPSGSGERFHQSQHQGETQ